MASLSVTVTVPDCCRRQRQTEAAVTELSDIQYIVSSVYHPPPPPPHTHTHPTPGTAPFSLTAAVLRPLLQSYRTFSVAWPPLKVTVTVPDPLQTTVPRTHRYGVSRHQYIMSTPPPPTPPVADDSIKLKPLLLWSDAHAKVPWSLFWLLGGGFALSDGCKVSALEICGN